MERERVITHWEEGSGGELVSQRGHTRVDQSEGRRGVVQARPGRGTRDGGDEFVAHNMSSLPYVIKDVIVMCEEHAQV